MHFQPHHTGKAMKNVRCVGPNSAEEAASTTFEPSRKTARHFVSGLDCRYMIERTIRHTGIPANQTNIRLSAFWVEKANWMKSTAPCHLDSQSGVPTKSRIAQIPIGNAEARRSSKPADLEDDIQGFPETPNAPMSGTEVRSTEVSAPLAG